MNIIKPWLAALLFATTGSPAAVPSAEKLLPSDTLVMFTLPDCAQAKTIWSRSPQAQLWRDPAMKAFKDKFVTQLKEEIIAPLERELGVRFADYSDLPQGQLTFAVTQNGWQGEGGQSPGLLLLLDTKGKSEQLKTHLTDLKKKWVDAGKPIRIERIRDIEFSVLLVSSNDMPKTLRKFFWPPAIFPDGSTPAPADRKPTPKSEVYVGQAESLLIVGTSPKSIEKVLLRLAGGLLPTLGEVPAYEAIHNMLFRDAPFRGWVSSKTFIENLLRQAPDKDEPGQPGTPRPRSPLEIRPDKVATATGLASLRSVAFNFSDSTDGWLFHLFLDVPESNRDGLFKILAGEPRETDPPPFVPADAVKFQRWRVNGQKAWATLEKMFNDISPQLFNTFNFLLESAAAAAKEKDPSVDLKKNLVENLGDDMISYEKGPRADSPAGLDSGPSLFLIGSPHAEQLAIALKQLLVLLPQPPGDTPPEREFLGRKIHSTPLPVMPAGGGVKSTPRSLHYSANGGYLAISTDVAMLEEYLRSNESPGKSLRDTPRLTEAAQCVVGAGTSWFGYENQSETTRALFAMLAKDSSAATNLTGGPRLPGLDLGLGGRGTNFQNWIDVSLLPSYEKIAKYFHFSVYGVSATVNGISLKIFMPLPPQLKK